jgi:bifunctional non-homologous end joining protein LigD
MSTYIYSGRYKIALTNPEKLLFGSRYTKGDLIHYYASIAPVMLKYIYNRPLMLHRFPDGIDGESFYQKDASDYFPSWIKQVRIPKQEGFNNSVVCQNRATLIYLANQACITLHRWLSRIDKLYYPDLLIFDLDPAPGIAFNKLCTVAYTCKTILEAHELTPFVMTTGSKGLHVVVPLKRLYSFEQVKQHAHYYAQLVEKQHPGLVTQELRKEKRKNKIFIDTLRNSYGATAVAPYSVRAYIRAPVATPLYWHELQEPDLTAQKYTIDTVFKRLDKTGDPWHKIKTFASSLKKIDYVGNLFIS